MTKDICHMINLEELYPNVSFHDKDAIHFKDGSIVEIKHLYHDEISLKHLYPDICWEDVIERSRLPRSITEEYI
jgi:hypothetical protein